MSTPMFYANQFEVGTVGDGTAVAVAGINIGTHANSVFTIAAGLSAQTKVLQFVSTATSCAVDPLAGVTINGGTSNLTVATLTGKTLYATATDTWVSF